jgi:transcriptional regulator with XRE-family HTH domain
MGKRRRDPMDEEIAKRVRALRLQRGLSQTELSSALGVTFQQVQKYERGANRISAGRLFRIAEVLEVPIAFFFADFAKRTMSDPQAVAIEFDFLQTADAQRLIRAYRQITGSGIRLSLVRLAETLAGD